MQSSDFIRKIKEQVRVLLNNYTADIENELKHIDPNVQITMESTDRPELCLSNFDMEKGYPGLACLSPWRYRHEP